MPDEENPFSFADIDDFAKRYGSVAEGETEKVQQLLVDATGLILDQVEDSTEAWVIQEDEDAEIPNNVIRVCVAAAYRAWTNPEGLVRRTLGQATLTYRDDDPSDALYLTAREVSQVRKAGKKSSFKSIGMVTPFSGDPESGSIFDNDIDQSL